MGKGAETLLGEWRGEVSGWDLRVKQVINNPVPVCPCPWRLWAQEERPGLSTEEKYYLAPGGLETERMASRKSGLDGAEVGGGQQDWGSGVAAKALRAGKEAEDLQTELMSTDLGWALREVRSDSFFSLFFSSRGNLS